MSDTDFIELMTPEVFEGAEGHIIILQEWPSIKGDEYLRVILNKRDAYELCQQIMAIADGGQP